MKLRVEKYIEDEKEEEAQMKLDPTKRTEYLEKPKAAAEPEEKKENPDLDIVASDAEKDGGENSEDGGGGGADGEDAKEEKEEKPKKK